MFLFMKPEYGYVIALVYPSGLVEKIYMGNNQLMQSVTISDEWYETTKLIKPENWEYIGL